MPSDGDGFCCYGCELAHRLVQDDPEGRQRAAASLTLSLILSMFVMMLSLFLYAEDIYDPAESGMFVWLRAAYAWAAGVLATPVVWLLGQPLARRALRRLQSGRVSMEALIVGAAASAYGMSWANVLGGGTETYFESVVVGLVMATFGRYVEVLARSRASVLVGRLLDDEDVRGAAGITPGTRVEVQVGRTVPVDMRARSASEVSLAVLTGESEPVGVAVGDVVPAGAVVLTCQLDGVALRSAKESTLERLGRLTEALRSERGEVLRMADRLAAWLTPAVGVVAALAFFQNGIEAALAVVLVACPCTYGVITPLISWLTLRKALEHGVVVRHAGVLDAMASVQSVAFDKTGTLTEPMSLVRATFVEGIDTAEVIAWVAALERDVPHPVAQTLLAFADARAQPKADAGSALEGLRVEPRGVSAHLPDGRAVAIGSPGWMVARDVDISADMLGAAAVVTVDGRPVGSFEVDERVRPDALEALPRLRQMGLGIAVLSGDREPRVRRVAAELEIDAAIGELSAEQKVQELALLDEAAFVGDGVNDAPAAAVAAVSFAVDGAASLQRGTADAALLQSDLRLVPWTLGLATRAATLSRRTLAAATLYNVAFVSLAAAGLLRPLWAGVSMVVASLIALVGASRITAHPAPVATGARVTLTEAPA